MLSVCSQETNNVANWLAKSQPGPVQSNVAELQLSNCNKAQLHLQQH